MLNKLAIVAVVAAIPAAYAQTQSDSGMMGGMMQGGMMMKHGMQMSEADKGYMGAMQTMGQSMMKTEMTGDPSADFVRMMIRPPECHRHVARAASAEGRRSGDQGYG